MTSAAVGDFGTLGALCKVIPNLHFPHRSAPCQRKFAVSLPKQSSRPVICLKSTTETDYEYITNNLLTVLKLVWIPTVKICKLWCS